MVSGFHPHMCWKRGCADPPMRGPARPVSHELTMSDLALNPKSASSYIELYSAQSVADGSKNQYKNNTTFILYFSSVLFHDTEVRVFSLYDRTSSLILITFQYKFQDYCDLRDLKSLCEK